MGQKVPTKARIRNPDGIDSVYYPYPNLRSPKGITLLFGSFFLNRPFSLTFRKVSAIDFAV
jgi:hypothetical protein